MASLPLSSLFLFLLLVLVLVPSSSSSSPFYPKDSIFLNCGSSSSSSLSGARLFIPDRRFLSRHSSSASSAAVDPSSSSSLYSTARVFNKPSAYHIPINEGGPHLLRLHFRPFLHLHSARFHVLAAGSVLVHDLSFPCMDKASAFPLVREFAINLPAGDFDLHLVPAGPSRIAFINAIQLLSVPADLLPDSATSLVRGNLGIINGVSKGKFETLYRINVGGEKVTPFNDTLWRNWIPDRGFLVSAGVKSLHFSGRIQYQEYGASREIAPDYVYNTARVMGDADRNMSWAFQVPLHYNFLVRLHFCDIASLALDELYFNVFINGDMAYENLDVSEATRHILAAPYYMDFVVRSDDSGRVTVLITPSNMSREFKFHGLLNGLEIMKMSNSMGNLDGDVPSEVLLKSSEGGVVGGFVPFILCAMLFSVVLAAGLMLVSRWRNASSRHVASGWSPLPIDAPEGKFNYEIPLAAGKTPYL